MDGIMGFSRGRSTKWTTESKRDIGDSIQSSGNLIRLDIYVNVNTV